MNQVERETDTIDRSDFDGIAAIVKELWKIRGCL